MNEAYFENVSGIGDLFLDKVFNTFEKENIVFICKDSRNENYLCICYEIRCCLKWVLCPISKISLLDLIYQNIDLKHPFLSADTIIEIIFDGENETSKIWDTYDFDDKLLPNDNTFLRPDDDLSEYILMLGCTTTVNLKEFLYFKYDDLIANKTNENFELNERTSLIEFQADISTDEAKEYSVNSVDDFSSLAA